MSLEKCQLCNNDSTPWHHVNDGHVCIDCYENSKRLFNMKSDALERLSYLIGIASVVMEEYRKISTREVQDKIECWFQDVQKIFYGNEQPDSGLKE